MSNYAKQKSTIHDRKPRTFKLNISDSDVMKIFEKAYGSGLTPSELLENFIGDLVYGSHTNGSDERMYVNEWFDRCGFNYGGEYSFLKYILNYDLFDIIDDCLDDIEEGNKGISQLSKDVDNYDEERKYLRLLIDDSQRELLDIFEEYCGEYVNHGSFTEEFEKFKKYRDELNAMLGEKCDD